MIVHTSLNLPVIILIRILFVKFKKTWAKDAINKDEQPCVEYVRSRENMSADL
jgi:hypothetical protein